MDGDAGPLRKALRRVPWWRLAAGAAGGMAALAITFLLRVLGLGVFLPEQALDLVVTHIPGALESAFIGSLGEGAKFLGLATAVAVVLAAYGIGAAFFRRVQARVESRWAVIAIYTFGSAALVLFLALPLLGAGVAGSATDAGAGGAVFSQLVGGWVYAAVLDHFLVEYASRYPEGFSPSRRKLLVGGAAVLGALALGLYTLGATVAGPARLAFASIADLFANEVTPTADFYTVTKNLIDPSVDPTGWSLAVGGLVRAPRTYAYADLQALMDQPASLAEQYTTMECVSNEVGGNLIGTARWSGVRLPDLLNASGVESGANWVEFSCVDGYTVSIPLDLAMRPTTLVVLGMNGGPLEDHHGRPARILVPGKYGMFSAKWVSGISVTDKEVVGFWQAKGWTDIGYDKTTALIAVPGADGVVRGPVTIGGFAYAGSRGISKVEVSTDGGATWSAATLKDPIDAAMTWVLWTYDWAPTNGGAYRVMARAYEADGTPQAATVAAPFPDGASGYDAVTLYVSG